MSKLTRDRTDLDAPIARPTFAPRAGGNFEIPASGIFDEPLFCFQINARWVPHLVGVIEALDQPDAWSGTETQIENARAEVRKLMAMMESCNEMITELRINNCIVEAYIGGAWVPQFDISGCVSSVVGDTADEEFRERPWDEPTDAERPQPINELDCVWGGVLSLVSYIFRITTTALDVLDAASDATEAAGDFITSTPGFSFLPPARALDAFSVAAGITSAIARLALIPEVEEMLACDLFCRIRVAGDPYVLTDDIYAAWIDWIENKATELPLETWSIGLGFIASSARDLVGRRYAYTRYILGTNNCDDDWMIICEECDEPEPLGCVDFSDVTNITFIHGSLDAGNGNPAPCGTSASGIAGNSLPLDGSGTTTGIACTAEWTFDQPRIIDGVSFDYWHNHNADNQIGLTVTYRDSIGAEIYRNEAVQTNAKNTWHSRSFTHTESGVKSITVTVFRTSSPAVTGFCRLDNICVVES